MRPLIENVDRRPGVLPEIRAEGDDVVFALVVAGAPLRGMKQPRLVLRCAPSGALHASIVDGNSYVAPS